MQCNFARPLQDRKHGSLSRYKGRRRPRDRRENVPWQSGPAPPSTRFRLFVPASDSCSAACPEHWWKNCRAENRNHRLANRPDFSTSQIHWLPELIGSTNSLLTKYVVGPCNKRHQIRRGDEASIFSINVRLGDRTGQRASRSYVEGNFVLYCFGNCLR
jgi:hypothetical protein